MPGYKEEEKPKPKPQAQSQSKPQPKPTPVQKAPPVESVPKVVKVEKPKVAVASKPPASQPTEEDIFGFNEPSGSVESKPVTATVKPKVQAAANPDDLFGISFNDAPSTASSQQNTDSNVNKLNEIMGKMSIKPTPTAMLNQFNTEAPGMGMGSIVDQWNTNRWNDVRNGTNEKTEGRINGRNDG